MEAHRVWRSVRAGSEAMKADMEAEEGRRGGEPAVEVGGGQPFSGAIAIPLLHLALALASLVWFWCFCAKCFRIRCLYSLIGLSLFGLFF